MLDVFQDAVTNTLRAMSTGLRIPVVVLLILLAAVTVFLLGQLIVETFMEHRHLQVQMPAMVDRIEAAEKGKLSGVIEDSLLLRRQKAALVELTRHPKLTPMMRESLAIRLIAQEKDYYDGKTRVTDLIAKIGPMLGLMGTLIPLGPGIIALGQGDTYTLSTSLLMAFDTTVAGLACAAVALIISNIRKRWYRNYMSMTETLMECTLEAVNRHEEKEKAQAEAAPGSRSDSGEEQRKQYLIEAYKAAYGDAIRAGYTEENARTYAKSKAAEALAAFGAAEGQKAGEYA